MIILRLICFLGGYYTNHWFFPGFDTVYIGVWLVMGPLLDFMWAAFKQRERFGFMRKWPDNDINGWAFFGDRCNNDGFIYFDWHLKQICWRIPRTNCTRAMRGGIGLGPTRAWFNIEADQPNCSCFSFHVMFPFSNWWDGPPRWNYPGRISIGHYPQNNEPETAPC